jgi:5'-3' exonuclease
MIEKFDNILIDTMNIAYRLKDKSTLKVAINGSYLFKNLLISLIQYVESLKSRLTPNGSIYLLFDNPVSRVELQDSLYFTKRKTLWDKYKANRKKESKEFYATLDILKYYFSIHESTFKSIKINHVEADDLVKPVIDLNLEETYLLVTNDMDWTRYLSNKVVIQNDLDLNSSFTYNDFEAKYGFLPNEKSVVFYKSIFGDKSDNVVGLLTENDIMTKQFLESHRYFNNLNDAVSITLEAKQNPKKSIIHSTIVELERQFLINYQVISAIPIKESHIKSVLVSGRNVKVLRDKIDIMLGLKSTKYSFGNIKRPRQ